MEPLERRSFAASTPACRPSAGRQTGSYQDAQAASKSSLRDIRKHRFNNLCSALRALCDSRNGHET